MDDLKKYEIWFVTGSQDLYGEETLRQVAANSKKIAAALDQDINMPVSVVWKPVVKSSAEILEVCEQGSASKTCAGFIMWMHTFSPAKMWIAGLSALRKPFLQFHTQFNRDIPWSEIDMDFMNLNQTAHGGREFGFIGTRMELDRAVVVGHWHDPAVIDEIGVWSRAACGLSESRSLKVARFGDNMRQVAVTDGDKVGAQITFGYEVHGYGVGDLADQINSIEDPEIDNLLALYDSEYIIDKSARPGGKRYDSLKIQARYELGIEQFLEGVGAKAFTTTFENLHGLPQLPGLAVQRLMSKGYGFGGEGDWKTAALVRTMKVMASGLQGGTSFMEDYTYHFEPGRERVLGAHMLELCPSIAGGKPRVEVHPLSIGGADDPARLVFDTGEGIGINVSIIDIGRRFRMVTNTVDVVAPDAELPKLPVARVVWVPRPNLKTAAAGWIHAGGAHHTGFSKAIGKDCMRHFAEMAGIEFLSIDSHTDLNEFKKEIRWNGAYYNK
jgi:L-arabinose isomerase